jgi:hypothetical protein
MSDKLPRDQQPPNDVQDALYKLGQVSLDVSRHFEEWSKKAAPAILAMDEWGRQFTDTINSVRQALAKVSVPGFTEEEKENLLASYVEWGRHGWTVPPNTPGLMPGFPKEAPSDSSAASIVMQYCQSDDLEYIFTGLQEGQVNQTDLEEAISCYRHSHYRSCARTLFAMIDAQIIGIQPASQDGQWRKHGERGIQKTEEYIDTSSASHFLGNSLRKANLFSCLNEFFAGIDDFDGVKEVARHTINRHSLAHGMSVREVTQKDCIQCFLAIYNLVHLLGLTKGSKDSSVSTTSAAIAN